MRFGDLLHKPEWEDWRNKTFPNRCRRTGTVCELLPTPANREEQERLNRIRNPTAVRTQNELRKVANNLVRLYGKPDLIRIELARDLGRSKRAFKQDKALFARAKGSARSLLMTSNPKASMNPHERRSKNGCYGRKDWNDVPTPAATSTLMTYFARETMR